MNLYFRELKAHRKALIIWSLIMVFLSMAGIGKYTASLASGGGGQWLNDMMKEMPKSLQALFGVGLMDLSKLMDYYGILFLYIALVATIHAVFTGNQIISKEERDKTAEFLLVKPISESFGSNLLKLMAALLVLQLIFLTLGAFMAAIIGRHKLSAALASGIMLFMFLLSILTDIAGQLDFLRYFTYYKYYDAKELLKGGYTAVYPVLTALFVIIFTAGTYYFYKKRDMRL